MSISNMIVGSIKVRQYNLIIIFTIHKRTGQMLRV